MLDALMSHYVYEPTINKMRRPKEKPPIISPFFWPKCSLKVKVQMSCYFKELFTAKDTIIDYQTKITARNMHEKYRTKLSMTGTAQDSDCISLFSSSPQCLLCYVIYGDNHPDIIVTDTAIMTHKKEAPT